MQKTLTLKNRSATIFNSAVYRTDWLKQFNTHEEYVTALNEYIPLWRLRSDKHNSAYANNVKVLLKKDGFTIKHAIKF